MPQSNKSVSWVDDLLAKLSAMDKSGVLTYKIGDQTATVFIGTETVKFLVENKALLIAIGLDSFRQFLNLMHEKRNEEAFDVLVAGMGADAIINRLNLNAEELCRLNDEWDKFKAAAEQFAIKLLESAAIKIVVGLL